MQNLKKKLEDLGVKKGVVLVEEVRSAESQREQIFTDVASKKSDIPPKVDDFLKSIDNELNQEIKALQEASDLQIAALKIAPPIANENPPVPQQVKLEYYCIQNAKHFNIVPVLLTLQ